MAKTVILHNSGITYSENIDEIKTFIGVAVKDDQARIVVSIARDANHAIEKMKEYGLVITAEPLMPYMEAIEKLQLHKSSGMVLEAHNDFGPN